MLGYYAAKLTGQPESYRRTVAIEVGTQSAGLSSGMAGKFFSPEAALPGPVAAVLHNITGAVYAWLVRTRPFCKGSVAVAGHDGMQLSDPVEVASAH